MIKGGSGMSGIIKSSAESLRHSSDEEYILVINGQYRTSFPPKKSTIKFADLIYGFPDSIYLN